MFVLDRSQGDLLESHLNALTVLGAGRQVLYSGMLLQEFTDTGFFDLSFVLTVDLVANQNEGEFFRFLGSSLVEEFGDPGFDVIEGLIRSVSTRLFVMS